MEATKKQKFIYSIWVILVLIWGLVQLLSITVYSFLSWTNVEIMVLLWLIPAITARDKKAWIRFLAVLSMMIAVTAVIRYLYTWQGLEFLELAGLHIVSKVLHLAIMIWALCVRKQVVEKSVLAKAGIKVAEPVNKTKAQKKAANEWVANQKKKQPVKRLDLDEITAENLTAAADGTNVTPDGAAQEVTHEKASVEGDTNTTEAVKNVTGKKETEETKTATSVNAPQSMQKTDSVVQSAPAKLDINRCTEDDFLTLPGMSLISAKRAVELRETQGDYQSVDDFVARNAIKPHFMVQMLDLIMVVEKKGEQTSIPPRRSRTLDL